MIEAVTPEGFSRSREFFTPKDELSVYQQVASIFAAKGLGNFAYLVPADQTTNGGPIKDSLLRVILPEVEGRDLAIFGSVVESVFRLKSQLQGLIPDTALYLVVQGAASVAAEVLEAQKLQSLKPTK